MISVLIPAYNAEPFIATAIKSILAQEVDLEVVVCDDGSTDRTLHIARAYEGHEPRVRVLTQPNHGAASARNRAFSVSRGDWIYFFDADDYLAPGSLSAMLAIASSHPQDAVYVPWRKFMNSLDQFVVGSPRISGEFAGPDWLEKAFVVDEPTYPGRFLFSRNVIEETGGWDSRLSFQDDMEFFARAISAVRTMRYCPDALFCYRQGVANSISNTDRPGNEKSHLLATRLAVGHLLAKRDTPGSRRAAARQLMLLAYARYLDAPGISREAEELASGLCSSRAARPWLPGGRARLLLQCMFGWKGALRAHERVSRLKSKLTGLPRRTNLP